MWEWNETAVTGSSRGLRGGCWYANSDYLLASYRLNYARRTRSDYIGFRVASSEAIPEPAEHRRMVSADRMCFRLRTVAETQRLIRTLNHCRQSQPQATTWGSSVRP